MKYFVKAIKAIFILVAMLIIAGIAFVMLQIFSAPDLSRVNASPSGYLSVVLDKDGKEIDTLSVAESNRIYVDLDRIPDSLKKAVIAIEDNRFYSHKGIDLNGIGRAIWHGVSTGDFSQGGSTLTQQLLKNNVFTSWTSERTFYQKLTRKIQEQYLAIRLEQKYSKDWILENYLNTINLGGGTRGVQVASKYYFGKDVSDLSLAEASLIAGITKNPTKYNPFKHPEESLARQHLVLDAMLREGYITEEEYNAAKEEDVIANLDTGHVNNAQKVFSWFEDALYNQVVDDLKAKYGYSEAEAWNVLYSGGLTVYSTEDAKLQKICEEEATKASRYKDESEASVVMMDPASGGVLAIIGSNKEKNASLDYNRATEAVRQPGSSVKIIGEYAVAMEAGQISLGTVVDDAPYTYSNGTKIDNADDKHQGRITIRDAIIRSNNIVALKTFQDVGPDMVYNQLVNFGITSLTDEDKNEALAIGGTYNGVTNLELTAAYNCLANGGVYNRPHYYTQITNHDGEVILSYEEESRVVVSKETAGLLTSAMEDVLTKGTGSPAYFSGVDIAGKSGTTNDNKDGWFVGYSLYYTCGVWGGKDDYSAQKDTRYVKELWKDIMKRANRDKKDSALFEKEEYESAVICTKCGNRAIDGLCDSTLQGDMAKTEYYAPGTAPSAECNCHVAYTTCNASGKFSGSYCPADEISTRVYLYEGSQGTPDEDYVAPNMGSDTCDVHVYPWSGWFGGDSQEGNENHDGEEGEEYHDDGYHEEEHHDEGGYEGSSNNWGSFFNW